MTLWLMSFPAFACLLVLSALVESAWRWFTGLGLIPWLRRRTGPSLSSIAFDEFTAVVNGNKAWELEHRRVELLRRDDEDDGAPPRSAVDLTGGTAVIVVPREADDAHPRRSPGSGDQRGDAPGE
ncbi:hypothetical protein GCM10018785_63150 [Streptomyces longispororuber]|uniref:Uncharacterized protein n=1 Tax=Streptomyces longispororuber TaxID=68230 RepID=A0A919DUV8_9ACTN|nr:DUF6191 domain-containing protein [Streptomyces longispororuber]GHE86847.1 hypothetical protein GCM10018785_63150 [Streptomyces longispororuber]